MNKLLPYLTINKYQSRPQYYPQRRTWGGVKYHKTNKRYKYQSHNYVVYEDDFQQRYIRYQKNYVLISSLSS